MGRPTPHPGGILIVGMLSAWPELFEQAAPLLAARFGPIQRESPLIQFDFTQYYLREMGPNLRRKFYSFRGAFDPSRLVEAKLFSNHLEEELAQPPRGVARPINLDPGCVDLSKLVLATTKDNAHRLYLGQGIYVEVTLNYTAGKFQPMPWTYPDYRTEPYTEFLTQVRNDLLAARKTTT